VGQLQLVAGRVVLVVLVVSGGLVEQLALQQLLALGELVQQPLGGRRCAGSGSSSSGTSNPRATW
jgi:hypothetical protein